MDEFREPLFIHNDTQERQVNRWLGGLSSRWRARRGVRSFIGEDYEDGRRRDSLRSRVDTSHDLESETDAVVKSLLKSNNLSEARIDCNTMFHLREVVKQEQLANKTKWKMMELLRLESQDLLTRVAMNCAKANVFRDRIAQKRREVNEDLKLCTGRCMELRPEAFRLHAVVPRRLDAAAKCFDGDSKSFFDVRTDRSSASTTCSSETKSQESLSDDISDSRDILAMSDLFHIDRDRCELWWLSFFSITSDVVVRLTFPFSIPSVIWQFWRVRWKLPRLGESYFGPAIGQFWWYLSCKGYCEDNLLRPAMVYLAIWFAVWIQIPDSSLLHFYEAVMPLALVVCAEIGTAADHEPHTPDATSLCCKRIKLGASWVAEALGLDSEGAISSLVLDSDEETAARQLSGILRSVVVPCDKAALIESAIAACHCNGSFAVPCFPFAVIAAMILMYQSGWRTTESKLQYSVLLWLRLVSLLLLLLLVVLLIIRWHRRSAFARVAKWYEQRQQGGCSVGREPGVTLADLWPQLSTWGSARCGESLLMNFDAFVYGQTPKALKSLCAPESYAFLNEVWRAVALYNAIPHDRDFFRHEQRLRTLHQSMSGKDVLAESPSGYTLAKQLLLGMPAQDFLPRSTQVCKYTWSVFTSIVVAIFLCIISLAPSYMGVYVYYLHENLTSRFIWNLVLKYDANGIGGLSDARLIYVRAVWLYVTLPVFMGIIRRFKAFAQLTGKCFDLHFYLNKMFKDRDGVQKYGVPGIRPIDAHGILTWLGVREMSLSSLNRRMIAYELMLGWVVLLYLVILLLWFVKVWLFAEARGDKKEISHWLSSAMFISVTTMPFLLLTLLFLTPVILVGMRINGMLGSQKRHMVAFKLECAKYCGRLSLTIDETSSVQKSKVAMYVADSISSFLERDRSGEFCILNVPITMVGVLAFWAATSGHLVYMYHWMKSMCFPTQICDESSLWSAFWHYTSGAFYHLYKVLMCHQAPPSSDEHPYYLRGY